jgi:hypothetical protein
MVPCYSSAGLRAGRKFEVVRLRRLTASSIREDGVFRDADLANSAGNEHVDEDNEDAEMQGRQEALVESWKPMLA